MKYKQHELPAFIPPPNEQDYEALKADMAVNGQQEPIKLYQRSQCEGWGVRSSSGPF